MNNASNITVVKIIIQFPFISKFNFLTIENSPQIDLNI